MEKFNGIVQFGQEATMTLETASKLENSGFIPSFFHSYPEMYGETLVKYPINGNFMITKTIPYDEMIRLSKTLTAFFTGNIVEIDNSDEFERMREYLTNNIKFYADDSYIKELKNLYSERSSDFVKACRKCNDDMFESIINLSTKKVAQLKGSNKSLYIVNIPNSGEFAQTILENFGFNEKYKNELLKSLTFSYIINENAREFQREFFRAFSRFSNVDIVIYTYIASGCDNLYKIGRSCFLDRRFKSLLTANPKIKIEFAIKKDVEHILHKEFANKKVSGEWFRLYARDLKNIRDRYSEFITH